MSVHNKLKDTHSQESQDLQTIGFFGSYYFRNLIVSLDTY